MLSFICYSLTHNGLTAAEVFSSLALFNGLRIPLNLLPMVLGQVIDAWGSVQRIEEFLLQEEMVEDMTIDSTGPDAIRLEDASFTWEKSHHEESDKEKADKAKKIKDKDNPAPAPLTESSGDDTSTLVEEREPFKLQDLNFDVKRNELVAVIGSVGSGKSSLLSALAGDMRKTEGRVTFGASRAFCPQYAWIQNTTLKNNIVFGKDMNKKWYNEVIQA
jgi:ABC-type multidrug transport system fused ATPase/permease subunit